MAVICYVMCLFVMCCCVCGVLRGGVFELFVVYDLLFVVWYGSFCCLWFGGWRLSFVVWLMVCC